MNFLGRGGKSVFFGFIRQRSRDEYERPVYANHEKRGYHFFPLLRIQNSA
jgi:hypothetical protein